jgi:hypothetical protein
MLLCWLVLRWQFQAGRVSARELDNTEQNEQQTLHTSVDAAKAPPGRLNTRDSARQ